MEPRILVIGNTYVNLHLKCDSLPTPGKPTDFSIASYDIGGAGFTQALTASRMGGKVTLITSLGDDVYSQDVVQFLDREEIESNLSIIKRGISTGIKVCLSDRTQKSCEVLASGANMYLNPIFFNCMDEDIKNVDAVIMQSNLDLDTINYFHARALRYNKLFISSWRGSKLPAAFECIPPGYLIIYLRISEITDLGCPDGMDNISELVAFIKRFRAKLAVVMLEDYGSLVISDTDYLFVPLDQKQPLSDEFLYVFTASLTVALAEKKSITEAVRFATSAVCLFQNNKDIRWSVPYRVDVENVLKRNNN